VFLLLVVYSSPPWPFVIQHFSTSGTSTSIVSVTIGTANTAHAAGHGAMNEGCCQARCTIL
jgi:hypothetical protein